MKNLKLTLAIAAVALTPVIANAQEEVNTTKEKTRHEKLVEQLKLSEEQATQVKAIQAKYLPKREELNKELKSLKEKIKVLKEERRIIGEAQNNEMKEVLTPDQQAKLKEIQMEQAKKKMMKGKKIKMNTKLQHKEGDGHNHDGHQH